MTKVLLLGSFQSSNACVNGALRTNFVNLYYSEFVVDVQPCLYTRNLSLISLLILLIVENIFGNFGKTYLLAICNRSQFV